MSSDLAVSARGVTKRYRIAQAEEEKVGRRTQRQWFTALDNVDLDIPRGTVLGVIGHNGSGKSTLLKIICRITSIDAGEVDVWGRIGSLLEVGTGFHGELTGRENVYLNGSILGMRKREIDQQFGDIVEFAAVGPFLDTPVKRYSSGMRVRLAFAVAAHLRPEILVVDEVLAVGDAEFQKRSLGKMHDVAESEGRTVLFVSHNMAAIDQLCSRVVVLDHGKFIFDGDTSEGITRYLTAAVSPGSPQGVGEYAVDGIFITRVATRSRNRAVDTVRTGDPLSILVDVKDFAGVRAPLFGVGIWNQSGQLVLALTTRMKPLSWETRSSDGSERVELFIPDLPLVPGRYRIAVTVRDEANIDAVVEKNNDAGVIDVVGGSNVYGSGYDLTSQDGAVYVEHEWSVRTHELRDGQAPT